jgi:multiple sugar transport system ATP-binding protein
MGDVIAVMNLGEVLQVGPPSEVYARPATRFVASFIGSPAMNFLPAHGPIAPGADSVRLNGASVPIPRLGDGLDHGHAILGVRPEHIEIGGAGALSGRVFGIEYMGARQLVTVDTDLGRLKIRAPSTLRLRYGEVVRLRFRTDHLVLFDGRSERALRQASPGAGTREAAHG